MKPITLLLLCTALVGCQSPQSPSLSEQPTAALVLRHRQLVERISQPLPAGSGDVNVTVQTGRRKSAFASGFESGAAIMNAALARQDDPVHRRSVDMANKERIEQELFRRWQAGDEGARLPLFDGLSPKANQPKTK
jgi:hypothetical protein